MRTLKYLAVGLLLLLAAPAQAGVQLATGRYQAVVEDLRVKVLGGYVVVERAWYDDRWHLNRRWTRLEFTYDDLDGSIKTVRRGADRYERSGLQGRTFRFGKQKYIVQTDAGFRWADRKGNWIDYDPEGRIRAYGDRNDVRVEMRYDDFDRLTGVFDHHGTQILWYDYDERDRIAGVRDLAGRTVAYRYDDRGLPSVVVDVLGNERRYDYDAQGRLIGDTDPEGRRTTIDYTATGLVKAIADPNGHTTRYRYIDEPVRQLFYARVVSPAGRIDEYRTDRKGIRREHRRNGRTLFDLRVEKTRRIRTDGRGLPTVTKLDYWDEPKEIILVACRISVFGVRGSGCSARRKGAAL